MMIFIAHRGNTRGPNPTRENNLSYINEALNAGFNVEIDVWYDKGWWTGHDNPQYKITFNWIINTSPRVWVHCKHLESLEKLSRRDGRHVWNQNINYFWHQTDSYIITSKGYIWTYPGKQLSAFNSIAVMPEQYPKWDITMSAGICSDYIEKYKLRQNKI